MKRKLWFGILAPAAISIPIEACTGLFGWPHELMLQYATLGVLMYIGFPED